MTKFVVLDLETTGLQTCPPNQAEPIEIAAVLYDPDTTADTAPHGTVLSFVPYHDQRDMLARAEFGALAVNGYFERRLFDAVLTPAETNSQIEALCELFDGATIVGANPAFDTAILWPWLRARTFGGRSQSSPPWSFRLFDVEAATMVAHSLDRVPSLAQCAQLWEVHTHAHNAHSALGDALVTCDVFHAIRLWSLNRDDPSEPVVRNANGTVVSVK